MEYNHTGRAKKTWPNTEPFIDLVGFCSHRVRPSTSTSRCSPQIENYIKESMKAEMAQLQQSAVHNHTAAMLEMGTNLLSQTAEQTRKLTDVETQVRTLKYCRSASKTFLALNFQMCNRSWWSFVKV